MISLRGFLATQSSNKADELKASPPSENNRSLPAAWSPSTLMKGLFCCLKFGRTVLHQCSEWVFQGLMHDKKKICFNNSTLSSFSHLVWDLGDWLCGIRGLMLRIWLTLTHREIPPAFTGLCPVYCIKLCPLVCVSPMLNMSAACELMGKPCLWWLSAAGGGNVVMLERPWCASVWTAALGLYTDPNKPKCSCCISLLGAVDTSTSQTTSHLKCIIRGPEHNQNTPHTEKAVQIQRLRFFFSPIQRENVSQRLCL